MAGVLVILLGVAVAVVAVIALQKPSGDKTASGGSTSPVSTRSASSSARSTPRPSTSATPSGTSSAPSTGTSSGTGVRAVPLVVLNNTTTAGLASQAAKRFESGGWTVTSFGNYSNDIASTCAYYDPDAAGAKAAAEALMVQYPTIKRIKVKFPELPAGPVVVVLTPDYSSN